MDLKAIIKLVYRSYIDDNIDCGQKVMIKLQNELVIETVRMQSLVRLINTVLFGNLLSNFFEQSTGNHHS